MSDFNWDDILEDRRREEVLDACRMLSKAQQSSYVVREGISAMMETLQKHWHHNREKSRDIGFPGSEQYPPGPIITVPLETERLRAIPSHNLGRSDIDFTGNGAPQSDAPNAAANDGDRHLEDIWSDLLDQGGSFLSEGPEWIDLLTQLTNVAGPSSN
ncbi:hypothetical protein PHISCL_05360 [Aspergillus sclerotialis]|uniref:Uncharacterized protein n=1 Tax=Aspergillus sclerotialis TaxID=2070753 RepID=A0A3A2ZH31_9EURO|nr:hypothetical protein PHISCL_05360 [Aspergillus sclerotialis]